MVGVLVFLDLLFIPNSALVQVSLSLMLIGGCLNLAAVCLNGFKMPVRVPAKEFEENYESQFHKPEDTNTKIRLFCDIFNLGNYSYSVGDIILYSGCAGALLTLVLMFI